MPNGSNRPSQIRSAFHCVQAAHGEYMSRNASAQYTVSERPRSCFIVHPAVCTSGALAKQPQPLSLNW